MIVPSSQFRAYNTAEMRFFFFLAASQEMVSRIRHAGNLHKGLKAHAFALLAVQVGLCWILDPWQSFREKHMWSTRMQKY